MRERDSSTVVSYGEANVVMMKGKYNDHDTLL